MSNEKQSRRRSGQITLTGIIGLFVTLFIFISSILFAVSTLKKNEQISQQYLSQTQYLNALASSMAHMSMWLNTYQYGTDKEQTKATQNIRVLTQTIERKATELHDLSYLDKSYTDKLKTAMNQLIKASNQIVDHSEATHRKVSIDALVIDYQSVFRIAEFHISTVRDLSLKVSAQRSQNNNRNITLFLTLELLATILIASIILFTISARDKAERNLLKAEGILTDLFESMPSALLTLNRQGVVTRMNPTASVLCKSEKEDSHLYTLFPHLKEHDDEINQLVTGLSNTPIELKVTMNRKKYSMTFFPMTQTEGTVLHLEDITKQEELSSELRHTHKMNAIGQLAGGIAHDFNNVLGGIINATELLQLDNNDEESMELLDIISNASMRASDLTRKLLTFSKKDIRKVEYVRINMILHAMDSILQHSLDPKITTELHLEAGDVSVIGDAANLQNVFINLGINAGHAMKEGGTIIYSTAVKKITSVTDGISKKKLPTGEYLLLEVSDTGSGIDPETITQIFDPFFTTKEHGTGIGLAVAYATINQCGGDITVKSTIGEGTTFSILLPIYSGNNGSIPVQESIPLDTKSKLPPKGSTILVIDDEEIIRKSASLLLRKLGYKVMLGANGRDGVELFRKHQDIVSVILLDMMMPVMNGDEALKEIRKISTDIPVIICTGFAHPENIQSINPSEIQGMLTKPYTLDALKKSIILS